MNGKKKPVEMLTKSQLKIRGWTDGLITQFLSVPDECRPNPRYALASPMKLYRCTKVTRIEQSARFQQAQAARQGRRQGAKRAVDLKRKNLDSYVDKIDIVIPIITEPELTEMACASYNAGGSGSDFTLASEHSDPDFLARITVNYLRHEQSHYESELQKIAGKVGVDWAYLTLKDKVLDAIAEQYPQLLPECGRQSRKMWHEWSSGD